MVLADDLIDGNGHGCLAQMADSYADHPGIHLAAQRIAPDRTENYGILDAQTESERLYRVSNMVEKPMPDKAPSNLGVVGRYILTPAVLKHLESVSKGAGGEIQLTDAIAATLREESVYGYEFDGIRYDCGSKLGYLKATVSFGLQHPELAEPFAEWLEAGYFPPTASAATS